ncbi:MAG: DUF2145 domain-containing protein [Magnetococcales bacterium]|nr:DUF2145 domain-containing protein [Magnetococcales bacterium]
MRRLLIILFLMAFTLAEAGATGSASASGGAAQASRFKPEQIIAFAKQVEKALAARRARVAILARMGRPLSEMPPGMHFTHVAFAVYSEITTKDGRKVPGYAIHNLYQQSDRPDTSELVMDFPVDFFADVAELEAGILFPSENLQQRLMQRIGTPEYRALHDPHYSVIANPYTEGRQNCTEFVLDVLHAAIYNTSDIKTIKAAEKRYFEAQSVEVNPFKLLLGAMFSQEVSTVDHPGPPVTATFEKIGAFLKKYDQGAEIVTLRP